MDVLGRMPPCLNGAGALAEGAGREFEDGWVYLGQFVCVFVSVVPGMEPKACSMAGEHSATEPCSNSMRAPYIWGLYGS